MKNSSTKKELQAQYKERKIIGGVYIIKNTLNNKLLLDATVNLQSSKNRFDFAQKTGSCVDVKLQKDWDVQEGREFTFEVLEELAKGETQTPAEFKADIALLKKLWNEKLSKETFY